LGSHHFDLVKLPAQKQESKKRETDKKGMRCFFIIIFIIDWITLTKLITHVIHNHLKRCEIPV